MQNAKMMLVLAALLSSILPAQQSDFHYFDPAKLVVVQGIVQHIDHEDVYGKKSQFLVLSILSDDQRPFRVEICPQWFFASDIAVGMKVQVRGSLLDSAEGDAYMIAQQISFQGQSIALRDRKGFPLWSQRGAQDGSGRGSGRGRHGKR